MVIHSGAAIPCQGLRAEAAFIDGREAPLNAKLREARGELASDLLVCVGSRLSMVNK